MSERRSRQYSECDPAWRDPFRVERNLSVAAGRCVDGDYVEFDVALNHDEPLQKIGIRSSVFEDVRAVDF